MSGGGVESSVDESGGGNGKSDDVSCGSGATGVLLIATGPWLPSRTDLRHVKPLFGAVHCFRRVADLVLGIPRVPVRTQTCHTQTHMTSSL